MSTHVEVDPTVSPPTVDAPVVPSELSEAPWARLARLSVDQYHAMIGAGILGSGDRIELLEGFLVTKMSKNPPHTLVTKLLVAALTRCLPDGWHLAQEGPLALSPDSEPEPDICVVRGTIRDYATRNPGPGEVGLVVEVSDSSLAFDRGFKLRLYARAGLPVYWIVNLNDGTVEVYNDPSGVSTEPAYRRREVVGREGQVAIELPGADAVRLALRDMLP